MPEVTSPAFADAVSGGVGERLHPARVPAVPLWTRSDGAVRYLDHLGGPPAPWAPEGRWERRLVALDAVVPGWDDAVLLGAVGGVLCALLAMAL